MRPPVPGAAIAHAWLHRRRQDLVGLWARWLAFCLAPVFSTLAQHYRDAPAGARTSLRWYALALRDRWFRGLVIASFAVAIASTTLFGVVGVVVSNLAGWRSYSARGGDLPSRQSASVPSSSSMNPRVPVTVEYQVRNWRGTTRPPGVNTRQV
jgi:hypothetical protein